MLTQGARSAASAGVHRQFVGSSSVSTARPRIQRHSRRRTTELTALTRPTEPAALEVYRAANPTGDNDQLLELLSKAARTKSVAPELVEGSLVALEGGGAKQRSADLQGRWRLVFSTTTASRWLQYIPVEEDLVMDLAAASITLESAVGPVRFVVRGVILGYDEASGELQFQLDRGLSAYLLGREVWQKQRGAEPKAYTFFHVDSSLSAARSSLGGLNLLLRKP